MDNAVADRDYPRQFTRTSTALQDYYRTTRLGRMSRVYTETYGSILIFFACLRISVLSYQACI